MLLIVVFLSRPFDFGELYLRLPASAALMARLKSFPFPELRIEALKRCSKSLFLWHR
jgi:hypothetical protein